MIFRQLTALNDWTFGKGVAGYATDEDAIALDIQTRLQSWKGDCFFAQSDFVDWSARLDRGQQANLVSELQSIILQGFGVVAINSFESVLDDVARAITITCDIMTIYSQSFINTFTIGLGPQVTT